METNVGAISSKKQRRRGINLSTTSVWFVVLIARIHTRRGRVHAHLPFTLVKNSAYTLKSLFVSYGCPMFQSSFAPLPP